MSEEMVMRTTDSPAVAMDNGFNSDSGFSAGDLTSAMALNSSNSEAQSETDLGWLDEFVEPNIDPESMVRQRIMDSLSANQNTPQDVPYERFREVNEQAKANKDQASAYDKWADVIKQFESQGYQSAADVQRALQEQQVQQREADIRQRYEDLAQTSFMDPEVARAQAEVEIQKGKYDSLVNQMNSYMTAQQRVSAFDQYPYANRAPGIVDNLINAGVSPSQAAQIVHTEIANLAESLVPELAGLISQQRSFPTPMDTSYSAQPVVPPAPVKQLGSPLGAISRMLGIGRNTNNI
jgi:hypothetical protein